MELLGNVLCQRKCGHFNGGDVGKGKEAGTSEQIRLPEDGLTNRHIYGYFVKPPPGKVTRGVITDGQCILQAFELVGLLNREYKMVAQIQRLRGDEIRCGRSFAILPTEIHVLGSWK